MRLFVVLRYCPWYDCGFDSLDFTIIANNLSIGIVRKMNTISGK